MNIEFQKTGDLTATLKIDVTAADYEENVNKVLKDYQKKAQMPGFRPGKVPFGLTKKMYGQAVTADEINKILSEALDSYIRDNNLQLLGNPLANTEKTDQVDFAAANDMSFYFDMALTPSFEFELSPELNVPFYNISATDKMATDYLADLQKRHGEMSEEEGVEPKPAELNEEFFEKIFPGEELKTEEQVLERIKKEADQSFVGESERKFFNDAIEAVIAKADIQLPDDFVKRWLVETNPEKLTAEDVERDYEGYSRSLRWQLIENRILTENNIFIDEEEIKNVYRNYFRRPGQELEELDEETKARIDSIVDSFMKNKEEVGRVRNQLLERKLIELMKEKLQPKQENLTYEEFVKLASTK
ncbi:MAG: trigger factor [Chloroflexota bacterium]